MESSELRHRMLQPPPQHPSNSCLLSTTPVSLPKAARDRTPSPQPSQPRLPPRPAYYLPVPDDEIIGDKLQEGFCSQPQPSPPPKHPSHPRQSAESTISTSCQSALLKRSPVINESAASDFILHPQLHPPDVSRVDQVNVSMSQHTLEQRVRSSSFESSSSYEKSLSEQELRDLYDDEEVDRFLRFFSAVSCSLKQDFLSIEFSLSM
jgi:hypothetical protein